MFREQFEREVDYLWQKLRRVGERHPRLEALYARNADARVARLVQSAAFAFASVHERLNDDGQAHVRPLVAAALPESLRPRPSSTILQLTQASSSPGAFFSARVGAVDVPFELRWPVQVLSMTLSNVLLERIDANLQVLRMTLTAPSSVVLGTILPDALRVFVRLDRPALALDLVRALRNARNRIRVQGFNAKGARTVETKLPLGSLTWPRVDTPEGMLSSAPADRFQSSAVLRDLYAFPESFCFFDVAVGSLRDGTLAKLELTMPLDGLVTDVGAVGPENLLLSCGPATNQYRAAIAPIRPAGTDREWPLVVADRPHAEILHVPSLRRVSPHDARSNHPILSWEAPASPHAFEPGEVFFLLEQDVAPGERRTGTTVSFASNEGFDPVLTGLLIEGQVLASDGELTDGLGLAEVGRSQGATNVTRVAPSRRASLGQNHPWRMNAYARVPPARFVTDAYLHEFFALHDSSDVRDENARVQVPRFADAQHERVHRLVDGMLEWGDAFSVSLLAPQASTGEAWLLGELLARAIAERNERLRYSTLTVKRDGTVVGAYRARQGHRLPFPLG